MRCKLRKVCNWEDLHKLVIVRIEVPRCYYFFIQVFLILNGNIWSLSNNFISYVICVLNRIFLIWNFVEQHSFILSDICRDILITTLQFLDNNDITILRQKWTCRGRGCYSVEQCQVVNQENQVHENGEIYISSREWNMKNKLSFKPLI